MKLLNAMLLTGICMITLSGCSSSQGTKNTEDDGQVLFIGDNIAVAQTEYGKVRGYLMKDVYTFLGVPYGASTAGSNRFMPPVPPEAWDGVRPAVFWGHSAPQIVEGKFNNTYGVFQDNWNYEDVSEDCLMLNVWTKGIDNGKRPVIVWLHGGGFTYGNAVEQDGYKGENLARYGDVVFVSVNHRLGPMGFTDLSAVDPKFKDSGNVGMLDLVAALRWINRNIAHFGGDPGNVTIIGQSGGGSKVCTLVAMPETGGLIHKGVALSGSITEATSQDYSAGLGSFIMKEAGLKPADVAKLQDMPWRDYLALANQSATRYNQANPNAGSGRRGFSPVADGVHIPKDGYFTNPNAPSAKIPMIFCTTTSESNLTRDNAELEQIDMDGLVAWVKNRLPGKDAKTIVEAYHQAFPALKPALLMGMIASPRTRVIQSINAKAEQGAPVYLAWFGWNTPLFDGRLRAFHCLDICFWFRNTDLMLTHTGGGKRPRDLSIKMADALLNFMRTGNPNGGTLPAWPVYTPETGATMMLNDISEVKNDPDRAARSLLEAE